MAPARKDCHINALGVHLGYRYCSLGLFEELSKGSASAKDLAARLGFHPDAGERLMNGLEHLGF